MGQPMYRVCGKWLQWYYHSKEEALEHMRERGGRLEVKDGPNWITA